MLNKLYRAMLRYSFGKLYGGDKLSVLMNEINAETWLGAQVETGGHALGICKPIGEYEMISIRCALFGNKSMGDGVVKTEDVDYWNKNWIN